MVKQQIQDTTTIQSVCHLYNSSYRYNLQSLCTYDIIYPVLIWSYILYCTPGIRSTNQRLYLQISAVDFNCSGRILIETGCRAQTVFTRILCEHTLSDVRKETFITWDQWSCWLDMTRNPPSSIRTQSKSCRVKTQPTCYPHWTCRRECLHRDKLDTG